MVYQGRLTPQPRIGICSRRNYDVTLSPKITLRRARAKPRVSLMLLLPLSGAARYVEWGEVGSWALAKTEECVWWVGETAKRLPGLEFPLGWFLQRYRTICFLSLAHSLLICPQLCVSDGWPQGGWKESRVTLTFASLRVLSLHHNLSFLFHFSNTSFCLALPHVELATRSSGLFSVCSWLALWASQVAAATAAAITPGTRSHGRVCRPQRDIQHTHYHPQIVRFGLHAMGCRGPHTYSVDASPDLYLLGAHLLTRLPTGTTLFNARRYFPRCPSAWNSNYRPVFESDWCLGVLSKPESAAGTCSNDLSLHIPDSNGSPELCLPSKLILLSDYISNSHAPSSKLVNLAFHYPFRCSVSNSLVFWFTSHTYSILIGESAISW